VKGKVVPVVVDDSTFWSAARTYGSNMNRLTVIGMYTVALSVFAETPIPTSASADVTVNAQTIARTRRMPVAPDGRDTAA
jgi:hypothetical protein